METFDREAFRNAIRKHREEYERKQPKNRKDVKDDGSPLQITWNENYLKSVERHHSNKKASE